MNKDFSAYFQNIKGYAYENIEIGNKNPYLIYKFNIIKIKDKISTIEMDPLGMILKENKKYYLYSLNEDLKEYLKKNEKEIIEDFVESVYLGNGIFSESTIISIK